MNARKTFSRAGWSFVVFEIATFLTELAVILIYGMAAEVFGWQLEYWEIFLSAELIRYIISVPAYYLMIGKIPAQPPEGERWPLKKLAAGFLVVYGLTEVGGIIGNILMMALNGVLPNKVDNDLIDLVEKFPLPALILLAVLAAPIVEELVFRKLLLDRIRRYGERTAVLVSGLIFGLVHGNFYQFFYAFAVECTFAYVYLRTGRLRYTIGYHMALNFLGSVPGAVLLKNLPHQPGNLVWMMLYTAVILALAAVGITLLAVNRKALRWKTAEEELPFGTRFRTAAGNSGMLALLIVLAALFIWNMI